MKRLDYAPGLDQWRAALFRTLPDCTAQIECFFADREFGFQHAWEVLDKASRLATQIEHRDGRLLHHEVIEHLALFHDIGRFFQGGHVVEPILLAQQAYTRFAREQAVRPDSVRAVLDGIVSTPFLNYRLHPSGHPPRTLEADIVRAIISMLNTRGARVDYHYECSLAQRDAPFFDPALTQEQRARFSLEHFSGDHLNVLLSLLAMRPGDFSHPLLQEAYRRWREPVKEEVVAHILDLARRVGESEEHLESIQQTISWYRHAFAC